MVNGGGSPSCAMVSGGSLLGISAKKACGMPVIGTINSIDNFD